MKIVAQMLVRNEADVILECLDEIARWGIEEIVVVDGASDDGTIEIVSAYCKADIDLHSSPDPAGRFKDHRRNELLKWTRRHNPDWVLSVDADEIYHTDPTIAIEVAEEVGANVVRCMVPQFWITVADVRGGLVVEDTSLSVQKRRRWYSWGHMGTFIWKENPDHFYPRDVQKRTPELPHQDWREWQRAVRALPICKHYPFRSLEQAVERSRLRRERGGRKYFGKYFENWIVDEEACDLTWFDGQVWNTMKINHHLVGEYMGHRPEVRGARVRVAVGGEA